MEKINFESLPSTNTPLNAESMNRMQENIENEFNSKWKILWENPAPTEQFKGTSRIELSSSDYDLLIWFYKRDKDIDYVDSTIIPKGYGGGLGYVNTYGTQNNAFREVVRHSDTNFEISFAFKGGYDAAEDNIIPIQVLGVKF